MTYTISYWIAIYNTSMWEYTGLNGNNDTRTGMKLILASTQYYFSSLIDTKGPTWMCWKMFTGLYQLADNIEDFHMATDSANLNSFKPLWLRFICLKCKLVVKLHFFLAALAAALFSSCFLDNRILSFCSGVRLGRMLVTTPVPTVILPSLRVNLWPFSITIPFGNQMLMLKLNI